jgi:hypothetical protein
MGVKDGASLTGRYVPEPHGSVVASRGEQVAGAEGHRSNAGMPLAIADGLAGLRVQEVDLVALAGGDEPSIAAECQRLKTQ